MNDYDDNTGLPREKNYLECGLPEWLLKSIEEMNTSWKIIDSGERDNHWDAYWCSLNSDINVAEVEKIISPEQAWFLREKYLRMKKGEF